MKKMEVVIRNLQKKYELISGHLNERTRRIWAAAEAKLLGHGGVVAVAKATGLSRVTIYSGLSELGNTDSLLYFNNLNARREWLRELNA